MYFFNKVVELVGGGSVINGSCPIRKASPFLGLHARADSVHAKMWTRSMLKKIHVELVGEGSVINGAYYT